MENLLKRANFLEKTERPTLFSSFPDFSPAPVDASSICHLPPEVDTPVARACDSQIPQRTHHPLTGYCVPYYYSSCGATQNLFSNEMECREVCPPRDSGGRNSH